jgi:XapX domain-containing protein
MQIVLAAFAVGIVFGAIVTFLKLPLPAPPNLAGIMGIVGVFVGYLIAKAIIK